MDTDKDKSPCGHQDLPPKAGCIGCEWFEARQEAERCEGKAARLEDRINTRDTLSKKPNKQARLVDQQQKEKWLERAAHFTKQADSLFDDVKKLWERAKEGDEAIWEEQRALRLQLRTGQPRIEYVVPTEAEVEKLQSDINERKLEAKERMEEVARRVKAWRANGGRGEFEGSLQKFQDSSPELFRRIVPAPRMEEEDEFYPEGFITRPH